MPFKKLLFGQSGVKIAKLQKKLQHPGHTITEKANALIIKGGEHLVGHKEYDQLIKQRLEARAKQHPGFKPEDARRFLEKKWFRNGEEILPMSTLIK